jgi:hypothetical protein
MMLVKGDEIPLYLADIEITQGSALSIASIDDLVATVLALLKCVPYVKGLALDIFVHACMEPPRNFF